MIDWLKVTKSANFYQKRRRLPKAATIDLFRQIRQNHTNASKNIFYHVKESLAHAQWSAIAFYYDVEPAFLDLPAGRPRERVCGFVMMVEYRDYVAVLKAGLDLPSTFKTEFLDRVGTEIVERAIGRTDTTFEQIRLRNMATSKHALRRKTLEASDLQSVVGPSGSSRFVPQGYRVRRGESHYSATPSTGRISERSDRVGHHELIRWSSAVIDQLLDTTLTTSQFIRTFARSIDLASLPSDTTTTFFAPNAADLSEALFTAPDAKRLLRKTTDGFELLTKDEAEVVIAALDQSFPLVVNRNGIFIKDSRNNRRIGSLVVGKSRISLRTLDLPEIEHIYIEPDQGRPPGEDEGCVRLKRFLDRDDLFTVLFNDFSLAYIDGTLYRDEQFADGGQTFLRYIRSDASLNTALSEKGDFAVAQQIFGPNSVFRTVVDSVSVGDGILMCDDLGDEWADFIGINNNSNPKTISFYHAKHGDLSLGASPFHVAVSQAMKNLSRLSLSAEAIAAKLQKWSSNYNNDGVQTQIPRLARGQLADLEAGIADARSAPDTLRRVFIVTSSLSRQQVEQAFNSIRAGTPPSPHFVQLYWLLTSFFSACTEVNAFAFLVCRD